MDQQYSTKDAHNIISVMFDQDPYFTDNELIEKDSTDGVTSSKNELDD